MAGNNDKRSQITSTSLQNQTGIEALQYILHLNLHTYEIVNSVIRHDAYT